MTSLFFFFRKFYTPCNRNYRLYLHGGLKDEDQEEHES